MSSELTDLNFIDFITVLSSDNLGNISEENLIEIIRNYIATNYEIVDLTVSE